MLTAPEQSDKERKFFQSNFRGGMRRNVDPVALDNDEYYFLSNGRTRRGKVNAVKLPSDLSGQLPSGKYQSVYGYGNYLIIFIDGCPYVRNYSVAGSQFALLQGNFQMSDTAEYIYTAAVSASWQNYKRVKDDARWELVAVNLLTMC
jgi:hypothetical protein